MVEVVVPEAWTPDGLATTLASLASQRYPAFSVASARPPGETLSSPVAGLAAILEARGHPVRLAALPAAATPGRRRQVLLEAVAAPYLLVIDDGVYLEPDLLGRLVAAIRATRCGFVGSAVVDLRFLGDHRPDEEVIEFWDGPVRPEDVKVWSPAWNRRRVHRGANLEHLRERLPRTRDRLYRVSEIRGCVLYDASALRARGGFEAPGQGRQSGPLTLETAAQLRLLAHAGGAGLFPSGAYRVIPGASELAAQPLARGDDSAAMTRPRRIRRGHHWRHAATAAAARRSWGGQIRAPGLPHHRTVARSAGGPRDG